MTSQDYVPVPSLVNTLTLTSYDVDLGVRTCSHHIPNAHALIVLREKGLPRESIV